MGVAAHLGIDLAEYDERIRTFIPDYDEMLDTAAEALPASVRMIVDLGTGTGALAARCIERATRAHIIGIDSDTGILAAASGRLQNRACFIPANFTRCAIPSCDALVASFSLHHVSTRSAKLALFRRIHAALAKNGLFIGVDCNPSSDPKLADEQHRKWRAHLEQFYGTSQAKSLLKAWSREDTYMPLNVEMSMMEKAGFAVEVLWRKGAFAVIRAER
ncbi:MAG: class I SAM-dependent methyltransferase [Terriglobales bacterium]